MVEPGAVAAEGYQLQGLRVQLTVLQPVLLMLLAWGSWYGPRNVLRKLPTLLSQSFELLRYRWRCWEFVIMLQQVFIGSLLHFSSVLAHSLPRLLALL